MSADRYSKQMEGFFDVCVGQVVELIRDHLQHIKARGTGIRLKVLYKSS